MRGVAAHRVMLELLADHRRLGARRPYRLEEAGRGAVAEARHGADAIETADALEVLAGRPAAVVANAIEGHHLGPAVGQLGDRLVEVVAEVLARSAVLVRQAESEHARTVRRLPPEDRTWQAHLVWAGTHEHVAVHAALGQDL